MSKFPAHEPDGILILDAKTEVCIGKNRGQLIEAKTVFTQSNLFHFINDMSTIFWIDTFVDRYRGVRTLNCTLPFIFVENKTK